jgi:serine/threonine-protein kinase
MPTQGRYRIARKIADGGMAEIFLATQHGAEGFQRPVVLKRILSALLADPKFRNMMIDEAHVAMGLNHSNIVQVLDLGQSKGRYFLVLEFVDGWDLHRILGRVRAAGLEIPPEIALYIIAEVCRALAYAHGRAREGRPLGIVHRDVSPHNVLISEQGEVKLTDFGIAKALGRRERTGQGVIKGKLAFMSPEQASGAELDARSDLFAVGTILYLMFTGRRPFEAATDLEIILRVQQCQFALPQEVKPDISPRIAEIIVKAMRLPPSERYQTAEEMLIDVERAQRTAFQPAGQTELKRWLAELARADGMPPVSRAPAPSGDQELELVEDLVEGVDVVFEEVVPDATLPLPSAGSRPPPLPPPDAREGSGPDRPSVATRAERPVQAPEPIALPGGGGWKRVTVGLIAVGAFAGVVTWTRARRSAPPDRPVASHEPTPNSTSPPRSSAPNVVPPGPEGAPAVPSPPVPPAAPAPIGAVAFEAPDAVASDAASATAPVEADGGAQTAAAPPEAGEADEDEEALLARKEANADETVIGADDAPEPAPSIPPVVAVVPPSSRTAPPATSASPARKATAKRAPAPPAVVSVQIASRPPGAVVKVKDRARERVFGRAPMNLRFRSGVTYELTFVKSGYVTTSKRFAVSKRKNQRVAVSLKKKQPTRKRTFFQRLFGR